MTDSRKIQDHWNLRPPACPNNLECKDPLGDPNRFAAVNPIDYPGWDAVILELEGTSIFHSAAWAEVLHRSYGHQPMCLCRFEEGRIKGFIPVMEVKSVFTGKRGVSLPFSDYCSPAGAGPVRVELFKGACEYGRKRGWKSFECRGLPHDINGVTASLSFYGHEINLTRGEAELWSSFKSRVRTPVRRAQEAGVTIKFETSVPAIRAFYKLHSRTRKKHGLPPQPLSFFHNVQQCVLEKGCGYVALALCCGQPVAAGVFMHLGRRVIHKFGASDPGFQNLGANHLLMWETIRKYSHDGFECLDLGRTSASNSGLRQFKQGFSGEERQIRYYKYDYDAGAFVAERDHVVGWYNALFRLFPEPLLRFTGRILYSQMS
jgi:CelD/BcsL family acetyltransferase involved in cellulose biosynthesis